MEEKKNNEIKNPKKYSYEELNRICGELYQQNQNLHKQLEQADMSNMFLSLDYMFKVVEASNSSSNLYKFTPEFVETCVNRIEAIMKFKVDNKEAEAPKEG